MLATAGPAPMSRDERWVFEPKYDGYRAISAITSEGCSMWSRNGLSLADKFPGAIRSLEDLQLPEVVLDGELVVFDATGRPRFQLIQQGHDDAVLIVFDVLWLDGGDLRRRPLAERRALLESIFQQREAVDRVRIADRLDGPAAAALAFAREQGLEGAIAKRSDSRYVSGRSDSWRKLKASNQQELVVVGFTTSSRGSHEVGALLLAYREHGEWKFGGRVGTGFTQAQRLQFRDQLGDLAVDVPPVVDPPRIDDAVWIRPLLVAQVKFTEWTSDGQLRHPSFVGFRSDKNPQDVVREAVAGEVPVEVTMSSPDRILYPRDGLRKRDLAGYYEAVAAALLPALRGRPVAIEHWNEGIDRDSWFQQDMRRDLEPWMASADTRLRTEERTIRHLVVDRNETLQWLAQRSVLTIHAWSSRVSSLDSPDWLVIDLDPAKGKGIRQAVEAALVFRRLLDQMELPSLPKTSGRKGLHLLVPLASGYTHEHARQFATKLCSAVSSRVDDITIERSLEKRSGRLYADSYQNGYGKTIVAPYSPRGLDGAPVSAPLKWSEVTSRLDPGRYTIRTMPKRLEKVGDLFADAMKVGVRLPSLT